jgi:hypothetical protein
LTADKFKPLVLPVSGFALSNVVIELNPSQSHIATDGQSVSQSVSLGVEPHLGLMTRYLLQFDSYGLDLWGALSDERTGLSFIYAAGPCQRSLSRVLRRLLRLAGSRLRYSTPPPDGRGFFN